MHPSLTPAVPTCFFCERPINGPIVYITNERMVCRSCSRAQWSGDTAREDRMALQRANVAILILSAAILYFATNMLPLTLVYLGIGVSLLWLATRESR